jgi:HlyD family secretion protein
MDPTVDIQRPHDAGRKTRRRVLIGGGLLVLVAAVTMGLSRVKPAAPSVERGTVWIDTVKRGAMLRQVRGTGTLVPTEVRWIPAATEGRIERVLVQPGTAVSPKTVLLEMVNPELELAVLDAESAVKAAEAELTHLDVSSRASS